MPMQNIMQHRHDTVSSTLVDNSNYTEITEKINTNGGNTSAQDFPSVHVNQHKAIVTSKYHYAVFTRIPINRITERITRKIGIMECRAKQPERESDSWDVFLWPLYNIK
jgi:hypothetical protein